MRLNSDQVEGPAVPERPFVAVRPIGRILLPEPARVVLRPFIPADDPPDARIGRATRVERILDRVCGLDRNSLLSQLELVRATLAGRHRDAETVLRRRYEESAAPLVGKRSVNADQALLTGAYLTEEYSFEAAALFNPSIVLHPDQSELPPGASRLVISLRAVGEGHISSISFRTATAGPRQALEIDHPVAPALSPVIETSLETGREDIALRLRFPDYEHLSQVVIFPISREQRHGIEDLRLVRFVEEDGCATYLGTYTAFSGEAIRQELLTTSDFVTFELRPLSGKLSRTKGMAIFPRRIDGRYAMLGRFDHENIWLLTSRDLHRWDQGVAIISPRYPWEFVQLGNGGSPIEIDEGWLVLTHGVGPIRNYCLGACLLDKRDPRRVLARSTRPIVSPEPQGRDGYVPNVVYSCGAITLGRRLLLPYGVADSFTTFAEISLDELLGAMS